MHSMTAAFALLAIGRLSKIETTPAFVGAWVGTLAYRDYSDNSLQTLGTLLRVYKPKGAEGWTFRYVYDDGPKKVVQETETVQIDWNKLTYTVLNEDGKVDETYTIAPNSLATDGTGNLVLAGKAMENKEAVEIRETLTMTPTKFEILRESRLPGKEFKLRHKFSFTRVTG